MRIPNGEQINEAFSLGNGLAFELKPEETLRMHTDLATVGNHIAELPVERSFAWAQKRPTRYSCWVAAPAGSEHFVTTDDELKDFDGDSLAGQRGLQFLRNPEVIAPLNRLKQLADIALSTTARLVGIPEDYAEQCSTRYRIIHYKGQGAGIGTHFDGNGLSAVLTDKSGLQEIRYDGTILDVDAAAISVMPGSSLHRVSVSSEKTILPTFHKVDLRAGQSKTSIAAFWNLPDKTTVPGTIFGGEDFYHDIGVMKNDDGPEGSLAHLWQRVAEAHQTDVERLRQGQL